MKAKAILGILIFAIVCAFTKENGIAELQFLEGTWKVENKKDYETWKKAGDTILEGCSYKIRDEKKITIEYLTIRKVGNKTIYTAKVVNQNGGQPVDFPLNKDVKDKVSFENPNHDFPKKIQYKRIDKTTLFVEVLGEGDKGFSYKMMKQDE